MHLRKLGIAFSALLVCTSVGILCLAGVGQVAAASQNVQWVKTELYLGRHLPSGHEVSDNEFRAFVREVLTKYFPKGLTILDAYGQIQSADGKIVKEATWVVLIAHEKSQDNSKKVTDVVTAYRKRFAGAKVLRLTYPTDVKFYTK